MALKEEMESQGNYLFKYRSYLPIILLIIGLFVYVLGKYGIVIGIQQIVNSDVIVEIALLVASRASSYLPCLYKGTDGWIHTKKHLR